MILAVIFGFVTGIAVGSFFHVTLITFVIFIAVTGIIFIYKYFIEERDRLLLILVSLFLCGFILGLGRMHFSNLYKNSDLEKYLGQKISAEGVVAFEPDIREDNAKLTIQVTNIGSTSISVKEKVLVTVPIYPEFSYGDKIKLNLTLKEPGNIESEGGRVFDYKGYLRVRGIWYISNNRYDKLELISSGNGLKVKEILYRTKHTFTNALNKTLPEPESSLMSGLLLGAKQSLGKDLLNEFQRAGVSHIVVLSGYNIAIVAESIMGFLRFLPQTFSFGIGSLAVILFTMLSGGGASAWRAAIMVLVALSAKKLNRDYKANRALGFAIVLMLAPNPLLLIFDPSFQLSVLATIGLIWVTPLVSPYLKNVTEKFGLREIVSSTIATQITVLPFLIYNTGILSLVSLPINILILGTIPLTMFLGFITGAVGIISTYLSFIPGIFAYILLWYQLKIIHIGANLSFAALTLPVFSSIILFFIYLVIFLTLFSKRKIL